MIYLIKVTWQQVATMQIGGAQRCRYDEKSKVSGQSISSTLHVQVHDSATAAAFPSIIRWQQVFAHPAEAMKECVGSRQPCRCRSSGCTAAVLALYSQR
jgi:hypothetical protein